MVLKYELKCCTCLFLLASLFIDFIYVHSFISHKRKSTYFMKLGTFLFGPNQNHFITSLMDKVTIYQNNVKLILLTWNLINFCILTMTIKREHFLLQMNVCDINAKYPIILKLMSL